MIRKISAFLLFVIAHVQGSAQAAVLTDYGQFDLLARLECSPGGYVNDNFYHPGSAAFDVTASVTDAEFCSGGGNAEANADVTISANQYHLDLLSFGSTSGSATSNAYAGVWGLDRIRFTLTETSTISVAGNVDFTLLSAINGEPVDTSGYFYFKVYTNEDYFYEAASSAPKNTGTWNWIFNDQFALPPGAYILEAAISTYGRLAGSTHSGVMDMTLTVNPARAVGIDIKPFDAANIVDPTGTSSGQNRTRVAILTDSGFDATQVAQDKVRFGPEQVPNVKSPPVALNVDGDGDVDLILGFVTRKTGISCGDTSVTLEGETYAGEAFVGTDTIDTALPCVSSCHP